MKKKIFVGLLASVLVCLTFVFTNAIDPTYSVSGTVTVYDEDNNMMDGPISIDVYRNEQLQSSQIRESGSSFTINVKCSDRVSYSYTYPDSESSASWETSYCSTRSDMHVGLHSDGSISND